MKAMKVTANDIGSMFPYKKPRDGQIECIEKIINAFNNGKRFFLLEAPTGSGKSVIAYTVSKLFNSAFYITSSKILQDQLLNDFSNEQFTDLKGRSNYICRFWEAMNIVPDSAQLEPDAPQKPPGIINCANGACKIRGESKCKVCFQPQAPTCEYYKQVAWAQNAHTCVMNFSSFLYQTRFTNRFGERDLLVLDECHNSEPQLMDFVSLTLNDALFLPDIKFPKFETAQEYSKWLSQSNLKKIIQAKIRQATYAQRPQDADDWQKILHKYDQFIKADSSEWVVTYKESKNRTSRIIELKPIFVRNYANEYLLKYGKNVLMMSATVLSPLELCDSLGIDKSEVFSYRMKSRFPVKNRPIIINGVGSMSFKHKAETMPKLVAEVIKILKKHPDERGIIHTHNFEIADAIYYGVPNDIRSRLRYQKNYYNKNEMLEEHAAEHNSVIVAPAMHEGLDLIGDLSKFQIICKVPYPALGDNKQLKARMEKSPTYYDWLSALKLIQCVGRSVRSETDYAITYILDSDINWFLKKANKMIPDWFKETII